MINENEIMIGGMFHHTKEQSYRQDEKSPMEFDFAWTTSDWYSLGECTMDLEVVYPIPLTEEWLLRLGFTYSDINGDSGHWQNFSVFSFQILGGEEGFVYANRYITTVHQLQNLYQSLCGKELTLS